MNALTFIELGQHRMARLGSPWGFNLDVYKQSLEFVTICCNADFYFQTSTQHTHCEACGRSYVGLPTLGRTVWQRDEVELLEAAIGAFSACDVLAASILAHAAVEDLALTRSYLDLDISLADLLDEVCD